MSKDNNSNLRLLGSPVNFSYRSKKKEERKNIRNRPRSALQNSCFTPDVHEKYKRPFSADTKERATKSFTNSFCAESLDYYNTSNNLEVVVPPTTELLDEPKKSFENQTLKLDKDICSNESDYGSEDTFISLGTKIKNKAQLGPKGKNTNQKNFIKCKNNILRRGKKSMDKVNDTNKNNQNLGIEVKINKGPYNISSQFKEQDMFEPRSSLPHKSRLPDSFFIPLDPFNKVNHEAQLEDTLIDHVSFDPSNIQSEVEHAIDTYSRRLTLTKQQLSLVEEESVQDNESVHSQKSSLNLEQSLDDIAISKDNNQGLDKRNTYVVDVKGDDCKKLTQNFISETRTYNSFYDDFNPDSSHSFKMSSTVINDCSSKDSGYPDSGSNDKTYKIDYSLPTSSFQKAKSVCKIDQPKSLDIVSTNSDDKFCCKTYPLEKKSQWTEPLNHSRLLYKEFFLNKEGHTPHVPNNSPIKSNVENILDTNETNNRNNENDNEHLNYPSYLLNSSTKAYTSKVIEDYKKELKAINNLHELTLKDIKTDAISPTPLDIDNMFEQNSTHAFTEQKRINTQDISSLIELHSTDSKFLQNNKRDVSKISTKELIEDYLKVKGDYKSDVDFPKNLKKYDKKTNNVTSNVEDVSGLKQNWNNTSKVRSGNNKSNLPINFRNQTHKNLFTMKAPLSARIESVQMDKDVDSWMSLTSHSPGIEKEILDSSKATCEMKESTKTQMPYPDAVLEDNTIYAIETDADISKPKESTSNSSVSDKKINQTKELSSNSTVLDIYSMLKEIESYGDNPVTALTSTVVTDSTESKNEESSSSPKDSFMEIFDFLEKVEQSANDALSIVTNTTTQAAPKLEALLKLPQTELAQRLVTASLQLEERSCCIALLQESLANHKEQMINKVSNLEKQSLRNIAKVKQECEEAIRRHQNFIDQLINDKKTLNHRIEQLVDERRSLEERWKRSAQGLEERYKLELRNQHDKMAAAHQVARQRWVRQKADKIKELTVKGLEGELREMAERQQKEIADLKMAHAEQTGRAHAKHAQELEELRRRMEEEKEAALIKERHLSSSRLEKQILELELTYQEQRTRLVAELRAENERVASGLGEREREQREQIEKLREEQEKLIEDRRLQLEQEIAKERDNIEAQLNQKREELEQKFEKYKKDFEAEQQLILKRKTAEISAQHKLERDREIEKAIDTMEAEAQAGRKELQEALRRHKEQYEAELRELGETEQATLRRYQDAQARVRHTEDRCAELEVMISQLESKNKVLTEKNSQLEYQVSEVKASCQEEWQAKVEGARQEIENTKKTHEEQMHQLYAKVKVAVARKDSAIQAMNREAAKLHEKITLLEQKLQQQRKDFLKHK